VSDFNDAKLTAGFAFFWGARVPPEKPYQVVIGNLFDSCSFSIFSLPFGSYFVKFCDRSTEGFSSAIIRANPFVVLAGANFNMRSTKSAPMPERYWVGWIFATPPPFAFAGTVFFVNVAIRHFNPTFNAFWISDHIEKHTTSLQ
jgi:hypothetical protein